MKRWAGMVGKSKGKAPEGRGVGWNLRRRRTRSSKEGDGVGWVRRGRWMLRECAMYHAAVTNLKDKTPAKNFTLNFHFVNSSSLAVQR